MHNDARKAIQGTISIMNNSSLDKLFSCKKVTFYYFVNNGGVNWRRIIYSINSQFVARISRRTDSRKAI